MCACKAVLDQLTSTAKHTSKYVDVCTLYPVDVLSDLPQCSLMLTRESLPVPS